MKILNKILPLVCIAFFQMQTFSQTPVNGYDVETQAYLIVTATKYKDLNTDTETDFSAAKGALVKLRSASGSVIEKPTAVFDVQKGDKTNYTADFKVGLDSVYTVEVTLNNKTYIIDNYRLKKSWKTHFLYHSTNGTKSAASVFRKLEDPETKTLICLYGVFPYVHYKSLGGSQF